MLNFEDKTRMAQLTFHPQTPERQFSGEKRKTFSEEGEGEGEEWEGRKT